MTKGMVGRVCGLGAVCCVALAAWNDRSDAAVQASVRPNAVTRPKTSQHAIGTTDKHHLAGKAFAAKPDATKKHVAKSTPAKHGTAKASRAKHAHAAAPHVSVSAHRHGRATHGVSTTTGPAKKLGYSITPPAKR